MTDAYVVEAITRFEGRVKLQGFKHSLMTVTAAALCSDAPVTIDNCPDNSQMAALVAALRAIGAEAAFGDGRFTLDATTVATADLPGPVCREVHGLAYLLPALVTRLGRASLPPEGGCAIGDGPLGDRPISQYAEVLSRFGAEVAITPDRTMTVTAGTLRGCEIDLRRFCRDPIAIAGPLHSGATKMAILCAALADGPSTLRHPYPKPDVVELVAALAEMGADIRYVDARTIRAAGNGGTVLSKPLHHRLITDLIQVVTWVCAGTVAGTGPLTMSLADPERVVEALAAEFEAFELMGASVTTGPREIVVRPVERLRPFDVRATSYGVFSDSQPLLTLMATKADGVSRIRDQVWNGRFSHVAGLTALGCEVDVVGDTALVRGPRPPSRADVVVSARDLRAAATLLIAGLCAPGRTTVHGVGHLARGYVDLVGDLRSLGATIHPSAPAAVAAGDAAP